MAFSRTWQVLTILNQARRGWGLVGLISSGIPGVMSTSFLFVPVALVYLVHVSYLVSRLSCA